MLIKKILPFLCILCLPFSLFSTEPTILVNNRVLATVNGHPITVVDVMKKMDVYINRSYPEFASSNSHRFQFFSSNWRQTLDQMIENLLILADAEKLELKISDGEVREKLHERFGPSVMTTLDKYGLTFDEAWDMIYSEMAVQRMSWHRVWANAIHRAGPKTIKNAYEEYLVKNPPKEEWTYQVLSIRANTKQLGSIYAQKAQALIHNEPLPFEILAKKLQEEYEESDGVKITVSDDYQVDGSKLSSSHKSVLQTLKKGCYSAAISQVSRHDKSTVHRIFHLKDHIQMPPPAFDSMVETLRDELMQKEAEERFPLYMKKLKQKFNFDSAFLDELPKDFQPFVLAQ